MDDAIFREYREQLVDKLEVVLSTRPPNRLPSGWISPDSVRIGEALDLARLNDRAKVREAVEIVLSEISVPDLDAEEADRDQLQIYVTLSSAERTAREILERMSPKQESQSLDIEYEIHKLHLTVASLHEKIDIIIEDDGIEVGIPGVPIAVPLKTIWRFAEEVRVQTLVGATLTAGRLSAAARRILAEMGSLAELIRSAGKQVLSSVRAAITDVAQACEAMAHRVQRVMNELGRRGLSSYKVSGDLAGVVDVIQFARRDLSQGLSTIIITEYPDIANIFEKVQSDYPKLPVLKFSRSVQRVAFWHQLLISADVVDGGHSVPSISIKTGVDRQLLNDVLVLNGEKSVVIDGFGRLALGAQSDIVADLKGLIPRRLSVAIIMRPSEFTQLDSRVNLRESKVFTFYDI